MTAYKFTFRVPNDITLYTATRLEGVSAWSVTWQNDQIYRLTYSEAQLKENLKAWGAKIIEGYSNLFDPEKTIPPYVTEGLQDSNVDAPKPATASSFLSKALGLLEERGKDYDQPGGERSMGRTVEAFNTITGHNLSEAEGWLLMQILKDVRQWQKVEYHQDSAEDCVSYAALKAEALAREG